MKSIIKRRLLPLIQTNPQSTVPLPSAIISSIKEDFHCLFKKFPVRIHLISSTNSPNFQYKFGKHTASFIIQPENTTCTQRWSMVTGMNFFYSKIFICVFSAIIFPSSSFSHTYPHYSSKSKQARLTVKGRTLVSATSTWAG